MTADETYIARCLQLAKLGSGFTAPNPLVGAVVVCSGKIIGEGYHHRFGAPHAEPEAIKTVRHKELLKKSTLYVNLEPCSHYGKTPPCADLIIERGIPKVVIATIDPNPKVAGNGIRKLKEAGVEVVSGILEKEAMEINKRFFCFHQKKRPYIILKWAQTADGFIDRIRKDRSEQPLQISNAFTRQLTHQMRAENMSLMVGTNTVLLDNPALSLRYWRGVAPVRIIIDRKNKISGEFHVKDGVQKTIVFTESDNMPAANNVEYVKIDCGNIHRMLNELYERKINSVIVEGGAELLNSFIRCEIWDEANIETAGFELGNGVKSAVLRNAGLVSEKKIEGNRWTNFRKIN